MMRPGDKLASYAALAEALRPPSPGPSTGASPSPATAPNAPPSKPSSPPTPPAPPSTAGSRAPALRALFEASDLLVWPGVGEGIGMVYLEAQAAGLPCLAEDRPGPRHVVDPARRLPPPEDPAAFAEAIAAFAREDAPQARRSARAHVEAHHGLPAAAARLKTLLAPLIAAPMTRIALLRHFPTDWNAEGRLQGRTDIPLSAASREGLSALALPPPWDARAPSSPPPSPAPPRPPAASPPPAPRSPSTPASSSSTSARGRAASAPSSSPIPPAPTARSRDLGPRLPPPRRRVDRRR
jgi:hypothetical protein